MSMAQRNELLHRQYLVVAPVHCGFDLFMGFVDTKKGVVTSIILSSEETSRLLAFLPKYLNQKDMAS